MFLSPGKSIFLYSPPLILAVIGFRRFWRRYRYIVVAMVLTIFPSLYLHARMISWAGDYAWGPRYLTFALAVLLLPAGFLVQEWLENLQGLRKWLRLSASIVVVVAGLGVTYLGNAIYWDHYIRIQNEAAQAWLGLPNNSGDGISTPGMPCPVCFETLYSLQWLPVFQHIVGNYWLLSHVPYSDDWVTAEKDAPWRRYTRLQLNIAQNYARARVDWWFVEYRRSFPVVSWTLVFALPFLSALMLVLFLLEIRRSLRQKLQPPEGAALSTST
jgi:hypothetical protein